jgi:hypothetical protein
MITKEQRDADIHVLSRVNSRLSTVPGFRFVISGSYAIEALTQAPVDHADMDTNIYTLPSLSAAIVLTATLMSGLGIAQGNPKLFKQTTERLEYDVGPRRLEFHFFEETLPRVPTILVNLKDSNQETFKFMVKSLPYTIATWAIRISGEARNPLRPVRNSDLDNFRLLLAAKFEPSEVVRLMSHHPQMPENESESNVLEKAIAIASKGQLLPSEA